MARQLKESSGGGRARGRGRERERGSGRGGGAERGRWGTGRKNQKILKRDKNKDFNLKIK